MLGLSVAAVALVLDGRRFLGSVAFCLALAFKQMSLYYAPVFFAYLLGDTWHRFPTWSTRCGGHGGLFFFSRTGGTGPRPPESSPVRRAGTGGGGASSATYVAGLGIAVVGTLCACFAPFRSLVDLSAVIRRIFPLERGLFEDKVANVWCALSVAVKLKQLLSTDTLARIRSVCGARLARRRSAALRSWGVGRGRRSRAPAEKPPT